ncbi:CDP-diacylglycerol--inositol 3-phosphatidyltransferase [Ramicandelaber brevisporus]|nr:CDP-diacylglycerol--inositol 3-phosphatidyltransferase [Ramicandelaber brevisporus]
MAGSNSRTPATASASNGNAVTSQQKQLEPRDVFYFVPNLIGYSRIVLAALALYYMEDAPWPCFFLYAASCLLDAVDGHAARYFDQCTTFGAVLDMVTDRCTTTCLLCFLASTYPPWALLFQFLISLDISSHYMHMYASLTTGAKSHKQTNETQNFLLRAYYSNNLVLFAVCFFNESFFVLLYLLHFVEDGPYLHYVLYPLLAITGVVSFGKQVINVIQFVGASKALAEQDVAARNTAAAITTNSEAPATRTTPTTKSRKMN